MRRSATRRTRSILESMEFPAPVIRSPSSPSPRATRRSWASRSSASPRRTRPSRCRTDEETGQTIIAGMGELHLEVLVDRMKREFRVEANVGKPQVAYRETIRRKVEKVDYTHKKQTGGSGQFAKVIIDIEPLGGEGGYEFENKVTGGRIPREYIPSVDAGCQEAMEFGVLAGYPMVGCQGHPARRRATTRSTPPKWPSRSPVRWPSRRPRARPTPALLEPMMAVEVTTPEDYMGDVIGDLNSRRGQIQSMDERPGAKLVKAPGAAVRDVRLRR